ncbi:MAG: hypothetical protein KC431_02870 [Myxococcales bacterium]|nr:hypothetical protein [Myxococcales bacterium]
MTESENFTVKGTHIMMGRTWVDERLGEGTFDSMAEEFEAGWVKLLPSSWYDVLPFNKIISRAASKLDISVVDAVTEIATLNAKKDLTTIYRAFMRAAGPKALLQATPVLWRNYVAFAEAKKLSNETGLLIAECRMIPAEVFDWAQGCWHGFLPAAIELAGGKNAKSRIVEYGDEDQPGFRWLRAEIHYT